AAASYRASDNGALREPGDRTTWLTVLRTSSSTITRACAVDGFTGRSLSDHVPALFQAGPRRTRWPRSPGRAAAGSAHGAPAPSRRSLGVPPAGARSVAPGSSALPRPRVGAAAPSEQRDVCHVTPARASRARIEQPGSGVPAPRRPTAEVPRQEPTSPRPAPRRPTAEVPWRQPRPSGSTAYLSGTRSRCPVPNGELPSAGQVLQLEM